MVKLLVINLYHGPGVSAVCRLSRIRLSSIKMNKSLIFQHVMSPASALVASLSDQSAGQHRARVRTNKALKRKGGKNRQKTVEVEMLEKQPPLCPFFFQKELSAHLHNIRICTSKTAPPETTITAHIPQSRTKST